MRLLIDIGHPGDVHLFKNMAWILEKKGCDILFTTRDKDVCIPLLEAYKFRFKILGRHYKNIFVKIIGLMKYEHKLLKVAKEFRPDLILSYGTPAAAHIAFLLKKPYICFEETSNPEQILLYKYIANAILTPECFDLKLGKRHLKYNGYHSLAYLHPNYFKPDPAVLKELGLDKRETFVLLRFVSRSATHDVGSRGLTLDNKRRMVKEFLKYGRVLISSEVDLPDDLEQFRLRLSPEKLHHIIYYATVTCGESAAIASESAALGTPAIYLCNKKRSFTHEQEKKYGAIFNFTEHLSDEEKAIQKGIEILKDSNIKEEWEQKKEKILKDKIDVTAFMVWFVENYPESFQIIKKDPAYQFRFR